MITLASLWLPILLSAAFVFILSSLLHMVLPLHRSDYRKLEEEDEVTAAMREGKVAPGEYFFPFSADMKELGTPEMVEKFNRGPVGYMVVLPNGPFKMGKCLVQWMVLCLVVSLFSAYCASMGLTAEASGVDVFRMIFVPAILGYAVSSVQNSIWKGVSWITTAKFLFDGLVYALTTAATFAWLWPEA